LNARTLIWDFVRDSLDDRWAAGYGWFAFWDDPTRRAPFLERIARERPEWLDDFGALNTAHSTFMEVLLALGAVGLVLVLLVVALSMGRAWWAAVDSTGVAMAWWVAVGTFALVENATESMITINPLFWLLLVAPGFAAVRHGESAGFDSPRDSVPAGHRREDSHMQPLGDQSAITA
jgi:O-antigen ligase